MPLAGLQVKQRTLQMALQTLDERTRTIRAVLGNQLLDPARRAELLVFEALKRAVHLLIDRAELIEEQRGAYHVTLWPRDAPHLVRQRVFGESAFVHKRTNAVKLRSASPSSTCGA